MTAERTDSHHTVARLEAALSAPSLPAREAQNCALLLDRLTRPVRVGVFGLTGGGDDWLLQQILGPGVLPEGPDWPTLEIVQGGQVQTHATFEDGRTVTIDGPATELLLADEPVFLRIEAPNDLLATMRFLYLASDDTPAEQVFALEWAGPRTDVAIWTSRSFDASETMIWAQAPDKLKNHAYLVATGPGESLADLQARAGYDFDGVFTVPRDGNNPVWLRHLLARLEADIAEARIADLDAAQIFLHRLGVAAFDPAAPGLRDAAPMHGFAEPAAQPAPIIDRAQDAARAAERAAKMAELQGAAAAEVVELKPASADEANVVALNPSPEKQAMLSEPILYLKRRARALLELMEWRAVENPDDEDWAGEVLSHCCETTEALQMRAMDWPDEDDGAEILRRSLDEACDVAILLQVEGGKEQAEDAAMMLLQLRGDLERQLAA